MAKLYQLAEQHSLSYASNPRAFESRMAKPPFNPLGDDTPFIVRDMGQTTKYLDIFIKVMVSVRYESRIVERIRNLKAWFPTWLRTLPRSQRIDYAVKCPEHICWIIRSILQAKFGDFEDRYLQYTVEWPFFHAVFRAMELKQQWHPSNVFHSAMYYSSQFCAGDGPGARDLLVHCWTLPSITGHVAAQQAKDIKRPSYLRTTDSKDIRGFFQCDLSRYGGPKPQPKPPTVRRNIGSLCNVPSCSQDVVLRVRARQRLREKTRASHAHSRKLDAEYAKPMNKK